jgi:hypothetical protein
MNHDNTALRELEQRYERLLLLIGDLQAAIGRLQQLANDAAGSQKGGGGGTVFYIQPIVIAAGGNYTGLTIYTLAAGTLTATVTTNATVYNRMAAATVATSGKYIVVGPNPDATWSCITQSC